MIIFDAVNKTMKTILPFLLFLLCIPFSSAQSSYTGTVDTYAIELIMELSGDSAYGAYAYKGTGDPIELSGKIADGTLMLFEKDKSGKDLASISFSGFTAKNNVLSGTWTNVKSSKTYKVELTKVFEVPIDKNLLFKETEIMQPASLENAYFKLLVSKQKGVSVPKVNGVSIYSKETGTVLQKIKVDCEYFGLKSVSTGDFNFDGNTDFSILKQHHAGPNTTSVYFLYDPKTKSYVDSGFTGVSLTFDSKTKRVTETNQSKAGESKTVIEYEIVNNKMVLLSSRCFLFDKQSETYYERPLKECQ